MIARIRKSIENKDQGFTLIELLVVMIIIGILAAVAIPIFLNQRKKAEDSAAKADVSTLGKEIATYWVDGTSMPSIVVSGNQYFMNDASDPDNLIGNQSNNVQLVPGTPTGTNATDWCVAVYNLQGDVAKAGYQYSATGGLAEGACSQSVPTS